MFSFDDFTEMQQSLNYEKESRQRAEGKLLDVEKKKSEQAVDLGQLQSQVQAMETELRAEREKVKCRNQRHIRRIRSLLWFKTSEKA